jgi:hypothetical protein
MGAPTLRPGPPTHLPRRGTHTTGTRTAAITVRAPSVETVTGS